MTPTVWTSRRKWMGNLVPALLWSPFALIGLYFIARTGDTIGSGLWFLIAATVVGWLSVNQFGLFENARMKAQLERILVAKGIAPAAPKWFVGFATPRFSSALDAHEDVGFLTLERERLLFLSETRTVEVPREAVRTLRYRTNVHSYLGLGRWVSVEGTIGDQQIRLTVEPREHRTLFLNRKSSRQLFAELERWMGDKDLPAKKMIEGSLSMPGRTPGDFESP